MINDCVTGELEVLDGKQRLTTIVNFINGEVTVNIRGKRYKFKDLGNNDKNTFLSYTPFRAAVYQNLTDMAKTEIFVMIQ